ncbi:MAG: two-CW domain-containing protein [Nitrospirota bacterium]
MKMNCWEFKKCGRQPGGQKVAELGTCIAAQDKRLDGVHGGNKAGRSCWIIKGTLCGGQVQSVFASKLANCLNCEFYKSVVAEEGDGLKTATELLGLVNK